MTIEIRKLLCDICKKKVRNAEAKYQKQRRLRIKQVGSQESSKIKINKKYG